MARFVAAISVLFLSACVTAPMRFESVNQGEWKGKARVNDKTERKRGIVNLRIKANESGDLRIDVTSPLGAHLASFLMKNDTLEYLIIAEKTHYKTKASSAVTSAALKLPFDIRTLGQVIFDRAPQGKNWNCVRDEKGYLKNCKDLKSKTEIGWVMRKGKQRTIDIENARVSLQINLYDFSTTVAKPESAFSLQVPGSFKTKNI